MGQVISFKCQKYPLLGLFLLAFLVRLPYLGSFMTIDEIKWVEGAGQFLIALYQLDFAQTYWHFHPGITITWGEAFILWIHWLASRQDLDLPSFVIAQMADLRQIIGLMRLSGAALTALTLPLIYRLSWPLIGQPAALLGSLLLALDPFFTAHARIVNGDAAAAAFMMVSVLSFLWLWPQDGSFSPVLCPFFQKINMAIISGFFGGLALLTKLPSPILIPWIGLLALGGYWRHVGIGAKKPLIYWVNVLVLWSITAILVYFLLWPAMWVAPLSTLNLIYQDAFGMGEVDTGHQTFFMNQITYDPGWLFYPVVLVFRLTPLSLLGLLFGLGWLVVECKKTAPSRYTSAPFIQRTSFWTSVILLAYGAFVLLGANISPKKLDRYVMAVIPPIILFASWGLTLTSIYLNQKLISWLKRKNKGVLISQNWFAVWLILGGLIFWQVMTTFSVLPYYLTYYNPLLGGLPRAATIIPVGWGEGLEKAATWLNKQEDSQQKHISSWYSDLFHTYSQGQRASFSDDGRSQLTADYVVFYINQIQRQKPYLGLVTYFRQQEPVLVVNMDGTVLEPTQPEPWGAVEPALVEVYQAPAAQKAGDKPKIEGIAQLLAYQVLGPRIQAMQKPNLSQVEMTPNQVSVTLFLRPLGPLPEDTTIIGAFRDAHHNIWGTWELMPLSPALNEAWRQDSLVAWQGRLTFPLDMPPGAYRLWAAFTFKDGPIIAEFEISADDPRIILE